MFICEKKEGFKQCQHPLSSTNSQSIHTSPSILPQHPGKISPTKCCIIFWFPQPGNDSYHSMHFKLHSSLHLCQHPSNVGSMIIWTSRFIFGKWPWTQATAICSTTRHAEYDDPVYCQPSLWVSFTATPSVIEVFSQHTHHPLLPWQFMVEHIRWHSCVALYPRHEPRTQQNYYICSYHHLKEMISLPHCISFIVPFPPINIHTFQTPTKLTTPERVQGTERPGQRHAEEYKSMVPRNGRRQMHP